jgi:hypothetical protein
MSANLVYIALTNMCSVGRSMFLTFILNANVSGFSFLYCGQLCALVGFTVPF